MRIRIAIAMAAIAIIGAGCANTPKSLLDDGNLITGISTLKATALRDCITKNWENVSTGAFVLPDISAPAETTGIQLRMEGDIIALVRIQDTSSGSEYAAHWFSRMLFSGGVREKATAGCI